MDISGLVSFESRRQADTVVGTNGSTVGRSVISKVVAILRRLDVVGSQTVTEIAQSTEMPLSTAHRIIGELAAWQVLRRRDDGRYELAPAIGSPERVASTPQTLLAVATPTIADLGSVTRRDVRFGYLKEARVWYAEQVHGPQPLATFTAAATLPAHATAIGQALLAFSPPSVVSYVANRGLARYTPSRRIIARPADVRDLSALQQVVDEGLSEFGHIDVVSANAGILSFGNAIELDENSWQDVIDVNLTGVWKTVRATAPAMVERGQGGSIILTSSVAGLVAYLGFAHYVSAKHGVTGLMRALAAELAPHMIRVNSVHPTTVDTPMVQNPALYEVFGMPGASREDVAEAFKPLNSLPIPWVDPIDISNAVLFLASDESRYVTGLTMTVDAGATAPYKAPPEA